MIQLQTPAQDTSFPASRPRETKTRAEETLPSGGGWCRRCGTPHGLPPGNARQQAGELLDYLETTGSIALPGSNAATDPVLATAPLFGESRGKMFGVLECCNAVGKQVWLYAFSGQYNGLWLIPGWAPPLFDIAAFQRINKPTERQIKALGRRLASLADHSAGRRLLGNKRKAMSQLLMLEIHALYRVHNFRGELAPLSEAIGESNGKPTGTGDCCAPKLLNLAAVLDLAPVSLAEFYFGRDNRSGSRLHGRFYPPCVDKCRPLLGFMLCGASEKRACHGC